MAMTGEHGPLIFGQPGKSIVDHDRWVAQERSRRSNAGRSDESGRRGLDTGTKRPSRHGRTTTLDRIEGRR